MKIKREIIKRKVKLIYFNRAYYDLSSGDLSEGVLYTIGGINVYSAEKLLIDLENHPYRHIIMSKVEVASNGRHT